MSNSPLATYERISPNRTSPRKSKLDTITIHCVVGQLTARQICDLSHFVAYDAKEGASCNYAVGKDGSIGLCVPESDRSWCSGGEYKVLGKSGKDNDQRAITIETASDLETPYAVTDAAYNALLDLCEDICRRNGKARLLWFADAVKTVQYQPQADEMVMTAHRWFANKACPGDYLYARFGSIAAEVTRRLTPQREEVEDVPRYDTMAQMPAWAAPTVRKLIDLGAVQGSGTKKDDNGDPADMGLSRDMLRVLVMCDRAGAFEQ